MDIYVSKYVCVYLCIIIIVMYVNIEEIKHYDYNILNNYIIEFSDHCVYLQLDLALAL